MSIAITAIGAITPLGNSTSIFFERLLSGVSGIGTIDGFDTSEFKSHKAGQVKDFQPKDYVTCSKINATQRVTQYAIAAAKNALSNAGIDLSTDELSGLVVGSAFSGTSFKERMRNNLCTETLLSPRIAANAVSSEPSGKICMELGIIGPTSILSSFSSSSFSAVQYAMLLIKTGRADRILVVATEELSQLAYASFDEMNMLATDSSEKGENSIPFSQHRTGFVIAEGAGAVLLESMSSAEHRQAKILALIHSCSVLNCNRKPIADSLSLAMNNALQGARLGCAEIDYICANANGSLICDEQEVAAIKKTFGPHIKRLPVSSIKDKIGETLGAAGVLSMISAIMAMDHQELPDNTYLHSEERKYDLNFVTRQSRQYKNVANVLINSFDSFGNFGTLILGRTSNSY
jgi:3-oxoacyl-[acyl-carrier-protein] synthase II